MGWPSPFVDEGVLRRSGSQHSSVQGPGRLQHAQSAIVGGTRRFFERQSPLTGPSVNGLSVRREHSENKEGQGRPEDLLESDIHAVLWLPRGRYGHSIQAWSERGPSQTLVRCSGAVLLRARRNGARYCTCRRTLLPTGPGALRGASGRCTSAVSWCIGVAGRQQARLRPKVSLCPERSVWAHGALVGVEGQVHGGHGHVALAAVSSEMAGESPALETAPLLTGRAAVADEKLGVPEGGARARGKASLRTIIKVHEVAPRSRCCFALNRTPRWLRSSPPGQKER